MSGDVSDFAWFEDSGVSWGTGFELLALESSERRMMSVIAFDHF